FPAEQFLGGAHHPFAPGEHAVDALAGVVPERQPHLAVLAVGPAERPAVEFVVLLGGTAGQVDLLGVEEVRDQEKTVGVIAGDLFIGEDALRHGRTSKRIGTGAQAPSLLLYLLPAGVQAGTPAAGRFCWACRRCAGKVMAPDWCGAFGSCIVEWAY